MASESSSNSIINIKVSSPERVGEGIIDAHVEYKIQVKTSSSNEFKSPEFTVIRRFKQFDTFREELKEKYKGYLIPPLPEKTVLNRFNAEFIEFRRRELQKFLDRVVSHFVLCKSPELKRFLDPDTEYAAKPAKETQQSSGFLSFLGSSLSTQIESLSQNFAVQKEPDQWFDAKKNYVNGLETQLTALERATSQLTRKQKELSQAYQEFSLASSLLSSVEADHDEHSSTSFHELSELFAHLTELNDKLVEQEMIHFEDNVRDYMRILGAVKEMLAARTEKLLIYQNHSKQIDKSKTTGIKAETEDKIEQTKNDFNMISDTCKAELSQMQAVKSKDFKNMTIKFVQMNIDIEIQKLNDWKNALGKLTD